LLVSYSNLRVCGIISALVVLLRRTHVAAALLRHIPSHWTAEAQNRIQAKVFGEIPKISSPLGPPPHRNKGACSVVLEPTGPYQRSRCVLNCGSAAQQAGDRHLCCQHWGLGILRPPGVFRCRRLRACAATSLVLVWSGRVDAGCLAGLAAHRTGSRNVAFLAHSSRFITISVEQTL